MKYNEKVLNEFFDPQNVGVIKGASGKGKVVSPDKEIVKLYIVVDSNKITQATFQAFGCTSTIACCSVATRLILNKTLEEAMAITSGEIENELESLPEEKKHSAKLAEDLIKSAINNYHKKANGDKADAEDED